MPTPLERGRRRRRSSSIARDDTDEAAQRLIANVVASSDDEMNEMKDNLLNDNDDDQSFSSTELNNVFDNVPTNQCAIGPLRKAVVPRPNKNRKSLSANIVIHVKVKLSRDQLSSDIESAGHILDVSELEALKAQRLAHQNNNPLSNNENNSEDEQANSRRVRKKGVVHYEESDDDFHVFDDDDDDSSSEEDFETPWKKSYKRNKTNENKNENKNNNATADNKVNAIPKKKKNESNIIDQSTTTKELQPSIRKQVNKSPSPESSSTKKSISLIANMAPQQSTMGASWAHPSATQRSNPTTTTTTTSSNTSNNTLTNTAQETTITTTTTQQPSSQNIQEISQQIQSQDNEISKDPKILTTDIEEQVRDDIDDLLRRILSSSKEKGKEPSDSFIPNTTSEQYDFFERDSSGAIIHSPPIPMFPEDFSHGKKEWPLSWWGILKPPDDLLALHEHHSKGNNGPASNNNTNNTNRYGNSGSGVREWERNMMNNSYRGNYGNDPMMAGGGPAHFNINRPPPHHQQQQQQRFPPPMYGNNPPNGVGGSGPWFGHNNMQGGGDWSNQRMPDRGGWREDGSGPGRGVGPGDRQHPQGFGSHQGHGIPFDRPRRPLD